MSLIKQIEITGFRGIRNTLQLSFIKNGGPQSMVILGRNGHGKSSITDSWEWIHSGDVERLRREHVGASTFPHRGILENRGDCYVAIELADGRSLRQSFNHRKIMTPVHTGDVVGFRATIPHPCHLRYEDLSRFVYRTKGEQYDALAKLMGFQRQVAFQKMLKRALRQVEDKLQQQRAVKDGHSKELCTLISAAEPTAEAVVGYTAAIAARHGLGVPTTIDEVRAALIALRDRVANDRRAQEMADLGTILSAIVAISKRVDVPGDLKAYAESVVQFRGRERKAVDLLLITLYEQGQQVIEARVLDEQERGECPLCGTAFDGDLLEHIKYELENLNELKADRDSLDGARKRLLVKLGVGKTLPDAFEERIVQCRATADGLGIDKLISSMRAIDESVESALSLVQISVEQASEGAVASLIASADVLSAVEAEFTIHSNAIKTEIATKIDALKGDEQRVQLATDYAALGKVLGVWDRLVAESGRTDRLSGVALGFRYLVEDFVKGSNDDVGLRFDRISADVARYFSVLEHHATSLSTPALRLLEDEDRAVTLEIGFLGEVISPAYKYLSESQLNSFGLALFLASVRQFNTAFRFLILDDIVNSFDGYKRPQLIQLLKTEFGDFQLVLLTHDEVWAERLFKAFPKWVRTRFTRYEPHSGPVIGDGLSDLEKIDRDLDDGEAVRAGQLLGPLLERELQELCEMCEGSMAYNRRNEYTLQPLLVCLRTRLESKLKSHPVVAALKALEDEQAFRNLCAHWKNPSIPLTPEEIRLVVDKWRAVTSLLQCVEEKCGEYAAYDGKAAFICRCGKLLLTKV